MPVAADIATCHRNSASGSWALACAAPLCPYPSPSPDTYPYPYPYPILCSACVRSAGVAGGNVGGCGASDWDLLTGRVFKIVKSLTFFKKLWFADIFSHCTSFFSSSMSRLSLALRFWNQVMTCYKEKLLVVLYWFTKGRIRFKI